jgi:hypothetical protein
MNQSTVVACPKCESTRKTIQLSVFAAPTNGSKASDGASAAPFTGGGCCGGSCGCH